MYLHSDTPSFIIYAHIHDVRAKATFVNREYFMWPMFCIHTPLIRRPIPKRAVDIGLPG